MPKAFSSILKRDRSVEKARAYFVKVERKTKIL